MIERMLPILIILVLAFGTVTTASATSVKVIVDGKTLDAQCVIVNGRTLAPVRAIAEAMGATVSWDKQDKSITLKKIYWETSDTGTEPKELTAVMWIGKNTGRLNYMYDVQMDVPPQIISGNTMIPVKALGEMLQAEVEWNQESKTVTVTSNIAGNPTDAHTDYITSEVEQRSTIENYLNNIDKPDTKDPLYSKGYNVKSFGTYASNKTISIKICNITKETLPENTFYVKLVQNEDDKLLKSVPFTVKQLAPNEVAEIIMNDFSEEPPYNKTPDRYYTRLIIRATN